MAKNLINFYSYKYSLDLERRQSATRIGVDESAQDASPNPRILYKGPLVLAFLLVFLLTPLFATAKRTSGNVPHPKAILPAQGLDVIKVPHRVRDTLPSELRDRRNLSSDERQRRFIAILLPLILAENERVLEERRTITALMKRLRRGLSLPRKDAEWLRQVATDYRIKGDPLSDPKVRRELLLRVDMIPPSLALAQAAIETGWGSSKAAQRNRNLFGMVGTAKKTKGRRKRHATRTSYLRFANLAESVQGYVRNLNRHSAYKKLRALRAKARKQEETPSGSKLIHGLMAYSELGRGYVKLIGKVIRYNELAHYDLAQLERTPESTSEIVLDATDTLPSQTYAQSEDTSTL